MPQRLCWALLTPFLLVGCAAEKPPPAPVAELDAPAPETSAPTAEAARPVRPRLAVGETRREIGEVDYGETKECRFPVRNVGKAPLRLTLVRKSCTCGSLDLHLPEVAPGSATEVAIRMTPQPGKTGPYLLAVTLGTNDPDAPELRLEVVAEIRPLVRMLPEDWSYVDFRSIAPGQAAERELRLVSSKLPSFGLEARVGHPGLEVRTEPLSPSPGTYTSGYVIRLRTTPQLPPGSFHETLQLKIRAGEGPPREVALPIHGDVENGSFEVVPRELVFGKASLREEDRKKVRVQFFVPTADEKLEVARIEPDLLVADPPKRLKPGLWEVTVRIQADHPAAAKYQPDGFLQGRVWLRTADTMQGVPLRVKWLAPGS